MLKNKIADFQMCAHVFGSTSSSSCSNYYLKRTAIENKDTYGVETSNTLLRNFYVDDLLKSVKSETAVIRLMNVKCMCEAGGFNLKKCDTISKMVWYFIILIDYGTKGYGNNKIRLMEVFNKKALGTSKMTNLTLTCN